MPPQAMRGSLACSGSGGAFAGRPARLPAAAEDFADAVVLLADLSAAPLDGLGGCAARLHEAACDAMFLFGARHLLNHGAELLAVFVDTTLPGAMPGRARALRAAAAFLKVAEPLVNPAARGPGPAVRGESMLRVSLHMGPTSLVSMHDHLERCSDSTMVFGEAVDAARALREHARAAQWTMCSSRRILSCTDRPARTGRNAAVPLASRGTVLEAFEILGVN